MMGLLYKLQPGCDGAALEAKPRRQFKARHVFEDIEHASLIDQPFRDLLIAMRARLKRQIIGRNGGPKALVIHRLQPRIDILHVSEFSHETRISNRDSAMQIRVPDQGRAPCPARMMM